MNISTLLESTSEYKVMQKEAEKLVTKWKATGLLEGKDLRHENDVTNMAVILENQMKRVINEASQTGTGAMGSGVGPAEQWAGVALPLVRRVFAEIAAKEFVSVQPMQLPSGLVFYLDFKYGTAQPGFTDLGSLYGITSASTDPVGGLYGAGRFGYSINETSSNLTATATATGSVSWADVNFEPALSASVAANTLRKVTLTLPTGADLNGVRSFVIASGSTTTLTSAIEAAQFPTYTSVNSAGVATFIVTSSAAFFTAGANPANNAAFPVSLYYSVQPTDASRGDFEDRTNRPITGSNAIPEINVELRSIPIVAKTRKLKAQWTPEFSQDLNAYHSIDAEAELTSIMSEYISMEIDLEILDMLIEAAPTVEYWNAAIGQEYNPNTGAFAQTATNVGYYTKSTWFQTLGIKVQKISNKIHQKTLRGGANFLVCSPTVATILESIPGYAADTNGDKMEFAMGVQKVGQLNSRFKVYKNPYMLENQILMGYRGSQFLETGAVYAPYIPLMMTPLVYDPTTFTPRKGLMTRYAKLVVRPEFYGKIIVAGIDQV